MVASAPAAVGGLLYSLIHLGGFAGDLAFYTAQCDGASRVVEFGCGDGRIAAALCLGEAPLTALQQQQQTPPPPPREPETPSARPAAYAAVELYPEFVEQARAKLAEAATLDVDIVCADFLEPLPPRWSESFDAAVVSSNTLFCTAQHQQLLERCADSLAPDGLLLLDVYNAMPWHEDASVIEIGADEEADGEEEAPEEASDLLVVVEDESGREWSVYEREVDVDAAKQRIACHYDFLEGGGSGEAVSETVLHHYLTPEQLVYALDKAGFAIEALNGGFGGEAFDPQESEHLCVVARRKGKGEAA